MSSVRTNLTTNDICSVKSNLTPMTFVVLDIKFVKFDVRHPNNQ